ncbi:phosphotransferase [Candidatus Poribacteria bacterium]|nr:phosphotransferase [Candidatus Poribacteria bacterium]
MSEVSLRFLSNTDNTVFRVDLTTQQINKIKTPNVPRQYILRIARPGKYPPEMIGSELLWLSALRTQASLVVPEPVPAADGTFVQKVSVAGVPEPRHCVLFRWIPGRFRNHDLLTLKELERVGSFIARLHRHAETFVLPDKFDRPRLDETILLGENTVLCPGVGDRFFSLRDLSVFETGIRELCTQMEQIGKSSEVFGMIHGDSQPANFLFHGQNIHFIDFSDCGLGYYLYDCVPTLSYLRHRPDFQTQWSAFFGGYQKVRSLSADYKAQFETFTALRTVFLVNWVCNWSNPVYQT